MGNKLEALCNKNGGDEYGENVFGESSDVDEEGRTFERDGDHRNQQ